MNESVESALWGGGTFGHGQCILAPNASPLTLDGTNTWIVRADEGGPSLVVDPGPLDQGHLDAIVAAAGDVRAVLLTHHHLDHSEGARALAERVGCGVRALDPAYQWGAEGLAEGEVVEAGGLEVRVIATPGHTADSLSFLVPEDGAVLTGDTVLGRGSTVVAHPDGELGAYLASLVRLRELAEEHQVRSIWPGHGPILTDAASALDYRLEHRRHRLDQVREALRQLAADSAQTHGSLASKIVDTVYADIDPGLWEAAKLSVHAQLAYLASLSGQ